MLIRIADFAGLNIVADPRKGVTGSQTGLSTLATRARNADVAQGSLKPMYNLDTASAVALTGGVARRSMYHLAAGTWLEWSQDVDVARNPLAGNADTRIYYTDANGAPKTTNLSLATAGVLPYPAQSYVLGITTPTAIGEMQNSGGSPTEVRAYTYTFVSPWGEEGPPADPRTLTSGLGAQVSLYKIGVTSRRHSSNPVTPLGIPCSVSFIGIPAPGFLRFSFTENFAYDFRVGDRFTLFNTLLDQSMFQSFIVSAKSVIGNGAIEAAANCWVSTPHPASMRIFRNLPVNTYNILTAVANTPVTGKVTVYVDTTEGLRVGEGVICSSVLGMTDLNGTHVVESIGPDVENPTFVVPLVTAQVFLPSASAVAKRREPHNLGETRITNIAFAAGTATITVESAAELVAGQDILILGVLGAYQLNGKRKIDTVSAATGTITVLIAALGAYTGGGLVIQVEADDLEEFVVSNVTSSGGPYPAAFNIVVTVAKVNNLQVGDMVIGQDIGGAIEANNVMSVTGATGTSVQCGAATGVTAYTAGGKLIRISQKLRKRIYRTVTGSAGAEFQLVADIPACQTRLIEQVSVNALGDILESDGYIQPPVALRGLCLHPHGFLMGFDGNVLHKTEPYKPWAWPLSLQTVLPGNAVGMAVSGVNALVVTDEEPVLLTGVNPSNMTVTKLTGAESCVDKRSVVAVDAGIIYRGSSGVNLIAPDGSTHNLTEDALPADFFLTPSQSNCAYWQGAYVWMVNATAAGYQIEVKRGARGLTEIFGDLPIHSLHVSAVDHKLYAAYIDGGDSKRAPFLGLTIPPAKFSYWTHYIVLPKPISFGAFQVKFDAVLQSTLLKDREATMGRNVRRLGNGGLGMHGLGGVALGGDDLELVYSPDISATIPTDRFLKATFIANADNSDNLVTVFDDFVTTDLPIRLGRGVRSDVWGILLEGNLTVSEIVLAEDIRELGGA